MKCYRVLYKPDNTGFMVWAESDKEALDKARKKNRSELDGDDIEENLQDYLLDEFKPETNDHGILVFYDIYSVYERNGIFCKDMSEISD